MSNIRERNNAFSRRLCVRALCFVPPSSDQRAQGRPSARRHPWALAQKSCARARRPQVEAENTPAFPARMVYGLYVISSVSQCSFATVASREPFEPARNLTPASGRQDHTTSPSAIAPLVSQRLRVHRIPHSTFVTLAIAPLQSRRDGGTIALICASGKQNYFFREGLTRICGRHPSGESIARALTAVLVTGSRLQLPSTTPARSPRCSLRNVNETATHFGAGPAECDSR